ncbi:hypothetical protein HD806DRAFT_537066 [Xylariaceae sp. AK1471]|nr:hypothetical protein HD806DRAFT_537066 [Xylariaceae sp. AK1471]
MDQSASMAFSSGYPVAQLPSNQESFASPSAQPVYHTPVIRSATFPPPPCYPSNLPLPSQIVLANQLQQEWSSRFAFQPQAASPYPPYQQAPPQQIHQPRFPLPSELTTPTPIPLPRLDSSMMDTHNDMYAQGDGLQTNTSHLFNTVLNSPGWGTQNLLDGGPGYHLEPNLLNYPGAIPDAPGVDAPQYMYHTQESMETSNLPQYPEVVDEDFDIPRANTRPQRVLAPAGPIPPALDHPRSRKRWYYENLKRSRPKNEREQSSEPQAKKK